MSDEDSRSGSRAAKENVRRSVIRGSLWAGLQNIAIRMLSLLTFVLLARLLTPEDYGIAALAAVVATLMSALASAGFTGALVQMRELDKRLLDAAFCASAIWGTLLAVIAVLGSWPLSSLMREPELRAVIWTLSGTFIVVALGSVPAGVMQRAFRFAEMAKVNIAGNVAATILGVSFALLGAGYWALIVQMVVPTFCSTSAFWFLSGYRPSRDFSFAELPKLVRVSRQFVGDGLITIFAEQNDKFIVGSRLSVATLGIYSVAFRVIYLMLDVLSRSIQVVALPAFARVQGDGAKLGQSYHEALRLMSTLTVPCFAVVGATSGAMIPLVFGARWGPAAAPMQVLCIYGCLQALASLNTVFLQATGSAGKSMLLNGMVTTAQFIALLAVVPFGLRWVAAVLAARAGMLFLLSARAIAKTVHAVTLRSLLSAVGPPVTVAVSMVLAIAGWQAVAAPRDFILLMTALLTGPPVYLGILFVISRRHALDLLHLVRGVKGMATEPNAALHR